MGNMQSESLLKYLIAGKLKRDFIITPEDKASVDIPGGSLIYAAVGAAIWDQPVGLIGRVGEDYPQQWLDDFARHGFDRRGIAITPESIDLRRFAAYPKPDERVNADPVAHFSRIGQPFPRALLDYAPPTPSLDSRTRITPLSVRVNEIPSDYLDANAAHICPLDYLSHSLLPSTLRQGHITTITLDPSAGYMNPVYWDDIPAIVSGLTAFIASEEKIRNLFQGRSEDLFEMMEALSNYGCEIIVAKRGVRGQIVYDGSAKTRWFIPSYPVPIADPTGAGDAFCGGFLTGYRNSYDPIQAAMQGNISASMVMQGSGYAYSLDTLPGLAQARLEALHERIQRA